MAVAAEPVAEAADGDAPEAEEAEDGDEDSPEGSPDPSDAEDLLEDSSGAADDVPPPSDRQRFERRLVVSPVEPLSCVFLRRSICTHACQERE